jgi:hypothetical protein
MARADLRTILAGLVVVGVGLFGEVGWALVYLVAGLGITVLSVEIAGDGLQEQTLASWSWWSLIAWSVAAALVVSGDALASKTTLGSWVAAWVIFAVTVRAGLVGRKIVLILLGAGAGILGLGIVAGSLGAPQLISNTNISVAMIVAMIPLIVELFGSFRTAFVAMAFLAVPVIMTGSRAGVLSILVIAGLLWPSGRLRRWMMVLGGVGAIGAIMWRFLQHPDSLAWHRWRIWGAVIQSIQDRPLWGIGAGAMSEAMGPYRLEHLTEIGRWGHVIGSAENMPLGLAVRVGLPALILAGVALAIWRTQSLRPTPEATAALAAIVTMGLFHDFWSEPAVLWWWAAVLGLTTLRPRVQPRCGNLPRRWMLCLAAGGIAAWALVQPAWAQWMWSRQPPSKKTVSEAIRAEPWFSEPLQWRVQKLLVKKRWTWDDASEALNWSRRQLEVRGGSAQTWGLMAQVNARIITEFGAWPATVENARKAFVRASTLEPRLPWYPYNHALMERGLGNLEGATSLAVHSVELEPFFARGWLLLTRLELDAGDLDSARKAFDRALIVRDTGESRSWTPYHSDLIRCPNWQTEALKGVLR